MFCFKEPRVILDLVFALDGSSSLTKEKFDHLKETLKHILKEHKISSLDTRAAVVEYSNEPAVKIYLNDTYDFNELNRRIDLIVPSMGRNAMTDKMLRKVATDVLSVSKGGRPGAAKALVILTDGSSSGVKYRESAAKPLKDSGVRVYVVITGDDIGPDGIIRIVSVPEDVVRVGDPLEIPTVGPDMGKKIENDVKKGLCKR